MNYKIMIIEDDKDISGLLCMHFKKFGFSVYRCTDFSKITHEFETINPHLVLLDINLPSYDGFYWCNKLRAKSSCPILFLSSRNSDSDQVYAMMNGGDDYITKPFSFDVITAKINALIRRSYGEYAVNNVNELKCVDCIFSKNKLTLLFNDNETELSKTEAGIIRILFEQYPNIVSREQLLNEIWDDETFVEENTLNVSISRLRKRLNQIGSMLTIKSVRSVGYKIGKKDNEKIL